MPYLECHIPGQPLRFFELQRKLSTLGSAPQNHIPVLAPGVLESHATIECQHGQCTVTATHRSGSLRVGGKKCKSKTLAHGDVIHVGQAHLVYSALHRGNVDASRNDSKDTQLHLGAQARLVDLSEQLLAGASHTQLLEALIDHVIELCRADKGFLVLVQDRERYSVSVSRGIGANALSDPGSLLSDDIVREVLDSQKPQIIANARNDARFCNSRSVLELDLSSVMCVPMTVCNEQLGLIYVGHDRCLHLFEPTQLKVLQIFASQAALLVKTADEMRQLRSRHQSLSQHLEQIRFGSLHGSCPQMIEVFRRIEKVATTEIAVWLHGESGTGKELLARELHRRSARDQGPFVVYNCAVIPEALRGANLFGREASPELGALARADKGTLVLCEIDKLSASDQLALADCLASTQTPLNVRVVTTSTQDPQTLLQAGKIREELYFRLSVIDAKLPALRDRGEDILTLANYFLMRDLPPHRQEQAPRFSKEARLAMRSFRWPGNLRQLEHHVQKALILSEGAEISVADLGLGTLPGQSPASGTDPHAQILPLSQAKEQWQSDYINRVLALNHGNRAQTARDLQVDPRTIFRHLERLDKQRRAKVS